MMFLKINRSDDLLIKGSAGTADQPCLTRLRRDQPEPVHVVTVVPGHHRSTEAAVAQPPRLALTVRRGSTERPVLRQQLHLARAQLPARQLTGVQPQATQDQILGMPVSDPPGDELLVGPRAAVTRRVGWRDLRPLPPLLRGLTGDAVRVGNLLVAPVLPHDRCDSLPVLVIRQDPPRW